MTSVEALQAERPDVFISYSRRDKSFVEEQLCSALVEVDKTVWIDVRDIPPTTEWRKQIWMGIEAAKAFAFVLSPDSLESEMCLEELEHAVVLNKRLIPILHRDVDHSPSELETLNWILLRGEDDFKPQFRLLIDALDTDFAWRDMHARLAVRAYEWASEGRDKSFLLHGNDLNAAEAWITDQGHHQEPATALHTEYILASRQAATRRQRLTLAAVATALVLTMGLAIFAFVQRGAAIEREKTAYSRELAAAASAQLEADPELSVLLASEAARVAETSEAEDALRVALVRSHLVAEMRGHTGRIVDAAYSDDGGRVVTASKDGTARVWESATGRRVATLRGHRLVELEEDRLGVLSASFSHNGKLVLTTGADGSVRLWDAAGDPGRVLQRRGEFVWSGVFAPNDQTLLTTDFLTTRVWNARTGDLRFTLRGRAVGNSAQYSPDGRRIVTASDSVSIWDASTGHLIRQLPSNRLVFFDEAAFSPDGALVAASSGSTVNVWETATGRLVSAETHPDLVMDFSFSPDSQLVVSGSDDGAAKVWEARTGKTHADLRGHTDTIEDVAFSPSGRQVATAGSDGTTRIWDIPDERASVEFRGHGSRVSGATFNPDGKSVLTYGGTTARVWETTGVLPRVELRGHKSAANASEFSSDGALLATSDGLETILWDPNSGRAIAMIPGGVANGANFSFAGDVRSLVLGSFDGGARVWDIRQRRQVSLVGSTEEMVLANAVSKDGRFLFTVTDRTGKFWDILTGRRRVTIPTRSKWILGGAVSTNGRFGVTWSQRPRSLWLWDAAKKDAFVLGAQEIPASVAAFSPDSRRVVVGDNDGTVRVWESASRRLVYTLRGHTGPIGDIAISPAGSLVVSTSDDGTARIWNLDTGELVAELSSHTREVSSAAFHRTGEFVATTSIDGTTRIWLTRTGREVVQLRGRTELTVSFEEGYTPTVAFSPTGNLLVTSTGGRTAFVYDCTVCEPIDRLLALANQRVSRSLSQEERATYLHE